MSDRPTLLLADDSVTIQRVIELTFAHEDIRVIAVGDGDHAIATLRHSYPDIVLADIDMPGKNGYELATYIKQTPSLAHVPVLLLTGAFEPVDQARARDAGCDGVLVKPFEPQAVIQRVKELLAAAAAATPPAAGPPLAPRPPNADQLDDYFDQLNQAFSRRSAAPAPFAIAEMAESTPPVVAAEPAGALKAAVAVPAAPLLAGAFSALLAAEQSDAAAEPFADWLPQTSAFAPPMVLPEETVELIVRRVIERLSDRVVRDTVSSIATATAERLVREEIERIKSHIK